MLSLSHTQKSIFMYPLILLQVKLQMKQYRSGEMTHFTESSPHFGCKLNVDFGTESFLGTLAEYQHTVAIHSLQLCNPIGLFNEFKFN